MKKNIYEKMELVSPLIIHSWQVKDENGQPLRIMGIMRDITLQKKIESEKQKLTLESLGVLAGGIAHDFNNLLSAY